MGDEKAMTEDAKRELQRTRLTKLFDFLKAYVDLRYPPVRDIGQQLRTLWLDDLPAHSSVQLFRDGAVGEEQTADFVTVLRIARPTTTTCPAPPTAISAWLQPGWQDLDGRVDAHPSRNFPTKEGRARIARFEDDPKRPLALQRWRGERGE